MARIRRPITSVLNRMSCRTGTIVAQAVGAWLLLFVVMFANGAVRVAVLQPWLGEERARQAASLVGIALVLASVFLGPWLCGRAGRGARA